MTFWNEVSHVASGVVHGVEDVAVSAAHEFVREANTLYSVVKEVDHQAMLLGEGVVTGALLNPINGIEQIVNNVAGTHLPPLEFSNQDEVNHSIAGKVGIVGGTIAAFVLTDGAAGAALGVEAGSIASLAVAGAVQGGILTPSDSTKTGGAFFLDRIENAAIDAASFAAMGGVAGKLGALYEPGAALTTRMAESAFINGVGGGVGGLVTAESTAVLKEGRLANTDELVDAVGHGTVFGAGFGAGTVALEAAAQAYKGPLRPGDDVRARLNRGYDNPDQVAARIEVKGEVSGEFINQVAGTMDKFADDVHRFMGDQDLPVRVGKQVTDINPALKGQHPDGWVGGTWENAEGFYQSGEGVGLAEYVVNSKGNLVRSKRVQGATRHEIGHGIDDMLTPFSGNARWSQSPEFTTAWSADVAQLTPAQQARFDYFIQAHNPIPGRGPSEAFADLFAAINGGSANQSETNIIMQLFPRTTQVIRQKITKLP